jgi:hypothetical protein
MNDADLWRSVVRVRAGSATGTGFLVAPDLILTCYHVVDRAENCAVSIGSASYPVEQVVPPESRNGRPACDLALLHVALPPLPVVELDRTFPRPGDALFSFGFTDFYPEGDSALFTFEGLSVEDDEFLYRLKSSQARPGMSGAPLLSQRTMTVVGVVNRSRDKESDLGARAVPIEVGLRLLPALAQCLPSNPRPRTIGPAGGVDSERAHLIQLIESASAMCGCWKLK